MFAAVALWMGLAVVAGIAAGHYYRREVAVHSMLTAVTASPRSDRLGSSEWKESILLRSAESDADIAMKLTSVVAGIALISALVTLTA